MGNIWGVMKAFHILICSSSLSDTYISQNSTILLICSSLFINYSTIKLILKIKGFQKACDGMAYGELIFYWQIIYYKIEKKYCWISEKNSLVLKKNQRCTDLGGSYNQIYIIFTLLSESVNSSSCLISPLLPLPP